MILYYGVAEEDIVAGQLTQMDGSGRVKVRRPESETDRKIRELEEKLNELKEARERER